MIDIKTCGHLTKEREITSAQRESRGPHSKAIVEVKSE